MHYAIIFRILGILLVLLKAYEHGPAALMGPPGIRLPVRASRPLDVEAYPVRPGQNRPFASGGLLLVSRAVCWSFASWSVS